MSKLLKKLKFIIISMSLIFIVIGAVVYADLFSQKKSNSLPSSTEIKDNLTKNDSNVNPSKNEISNNEVAKDETSNDTTNILLLDDKSDSMVVASVDTANKNIQLTPVANTGYFDRSNMEDLLNNIEKNVNMNLDKFLQVDISELKDVISLLGDVNVNIKPEDVQLVNNLIPKFYGEFQDSSKGEMKFITSSGEQNINEYQLMAYISTIAKDSNKQKEALLSLAKSIKNLGFSKYFEIYNKIKPYVETNLTIPDMLKIASTNYEFK